jgi:hypothetical protein
MSLKVTRLLLSDVNKHFHWLQYIFRHRHDNNGKKKKQDDATIERDPRTSPRQPAIANKNKTKQKNLYDEYSPPNPGPVTSRHRTEYPYDPNSYTPPSSISRLLVLVSNSVAESVFLPSVRSCLQSTEETPQPETPHSCTTTLPPVASHSARNSRSWSVVVVFQAGEDAAADLGEEDESGE